MPATESSETCARLRAESWKLLSNSPSTTSARPTPILPKRLARSPVLILALLASSRTTIEPALALEDSAWRKPSAFTFLGRSYSWLCATGPMALAPPTNSGAERAPWRAWPVPFCLYIFFFVRFTSARVRILCVPARRLASCQTTTRWIRSARGSRPKMSSFSSTSPADLLSRLRTFVFISGLCSRFRRHFFGQRCGLLALRNRTRHRRILVRLLDGVAHHHPAALGARHRAAHHDEAALDIDFRDFEILRCDVLVAVMAVHLLVLESLARILTAARAAQRAVGDRHAVRRFKAAEIPALHGAGETTADGDACDVHFLAGHEMIRLQQIAHLKQVLRIDAEFREFLAGLHFGLRELTAIGLAETLGFRKAGPELNGRVAILLFGAR